MRQTAYIGPLRFEADLGPGCEGLGFPPAFFRRTGFSHHTEYTVDMASSQGPITPPSGRPVEADGFDEVREGETLRRYAYQQIDGGKRYYASTALIGHHIQVTVDLRPGWVFGRGLEVWRYLMLERLLCREGAAVLHSASVIWQGRAILFTAPSGTGKSTQAELWKRYAGAAGLNGDRNILLCREGVWTVCGLPWHGSSADCASVEVPLGAIVVVRRAPASSVTKLSPLERFRLISSEVTHNNWNRAFAQQMGDLVCELISGVPIVQLNCTMGQDAVDCLRRYLER